METKLCEHRTLGGNKCDAPALRDRAYCRHHLRFYDPQDMPAGRTDYAPAVPDAPEAALLSVHQATRAFLAGKIDEKTCRLLIYAAQVNSQIMGQRLAHQRHVEHVEQEYFKQIAAEDRANALLQHAIRAIGKGEDSPEIRKEIEELLKPFQRPRVPRIPQIDAQLAAQPHE